MSCASRGLQCHFMCDVQDARLMSGQQQLLSSLFTFSKVAGTTSPLNPKLGPQLGQLKQHESQNSKASATKYLQHKHAVCCCDTSR